MRDTAAFLAARDSLAFFGACVRAAFFAAGALVAGLAVRVVALATFLDATDFRFTAGAAAAFFAGDRAPALAGALPAGLAAALLAAPVFLAGETAFPSPRRAAPCFDFAMSLALESCGDATACYSVVVPAGQPISTACAAGAIHPPAILLTRVLLFLIALYKRLLSPFLGAHCRFHPSCSTYARIAIARFGPWRGSLLAGWRILRCQPLCEGGLDPVPESFTLSRCRHREGAE